MAAASVPESARLDALPVKCALLRRVLAHARLQECLLRSAAAGGEVTRAQAARCLTAALRPPRAARLLRLRALTAALVASRGRGSLLLWSLLNPRLRAVEPGDIRRGGSLCILCSRGLQILSGLFVGVSFLLLCHALAPDSTSLLGVVARVETRRRIIASLINPALIVLPQALQTL